MENIRKLINDLDHLDGSSYIIKETMRAIAKDISSMASSEPDKQMQRRSVLSDLAHAIRMALVDIERETFEKGAFAMKPHAKGVRR